jgi:hypothetical protein
MNGKGSRARSRNVSHEAYAANFDRIFAAGLDERKWGYALRPDARYWEPASATDRQAVIDEARDHYGNNAFAICRCEPLDLVSLMPDANDLCEQIAQAAFDTYGVDDVCPEDMCTVADLAALTQMTRDWARKHLIGEATPWIAVDIEEFPAIVNGEPLPANVHRIGR